MTEREAIAANAYLRAYGTQPGATQNERLWGLKASSEDALLAILRALYPTEWPEDGADGIYRIREHARFRAAADFLGQIEQNGHDEFIVAICIVPVIDRAMKDFRDPVPSA